MHPDTEHNTPSLPTDRPTDRRALLAGLGGLAAGAFLAGPANAGPLSPPPGPIAPTPGPEPRVPINAQTTPGDANSIYRITQPGSYYLTQNLIGNGINGILIAASNVSIDMMGFEVRGVGALSTGIGTSLPGGQPLNNISIVNGSVRNWTNGIALDAIAGRLENIHAQGNKLIGIRSGTAFTVTRCTATDNGQTGLRVDSRSTVTNCIAQGNGGSGILVSGRGMITACSAFENGTGISIGSGSTISNCIVELNQGTGIAGGSDNLIMHNKIFDNRRSDGQQGSGIALSGQGNIIDGNNIILQLLGVLLFDVGNIVVRNSLRAVGNPLAVGNGNTVGPTIDAASIASSNNPHANYFY